MGCLVLLLIISNIGLWWTLGIICKELDNSFKRLTQNFNEKIFNIRRNIK